jgi:antitoxin (DNA-binding transcriptional repressor) of toxin-antitoxin stability system
VVNVHQAKTHLSRLIDDAHAAETIVLAKAGKPWARLIPWRRPPPSASGAGCAAVVPSASQTCCSTPWTPVTWRAGSPAPCGRRLRSHEP